MTRKQAYDVSKNSNGDDKRKSLEMEDFSPGNKILMREDDKVGKVATGLLDEKHVIMKLNSLIFLQN